MWNGMLELFTLWGNQPKATTRVGRLGIGQGGTDVPFCAGRLLCSREQQVELSPLFSRPNEQWRVVVNMLRCWDSAWPVPFAPSWRRRVGRQLVTSHALKKSETVKHTHHTHTTQGARCRIAPRTLGKCLLCVIILMTTLVDNVGFIKGLDKYNMPRPGDVMVLVHRGSDSASTAGAV